MPGNHEDNALVWKNRTNTTHPRDYTSTDIPNHVFGDVFSKFSVNGLPHEILGLIFESVLNLSLPGAKLQSSVTLSHVCSHWGRIAITTPRLWSRIDIRLYYGQADFDKAAVRWDVLVKRSAQCPLDVQIQELSNLHGRYIIDDQEMTAHMCTLVETIAPRTHRFAIQTRIGFQAGCAPRNLVVAFLQACVPGVLKAFYASIDHERRSGRIYSRTTEEPQTFESLLKSALAPNLGQYCPGAQGKAYQGLVELRLYHSFSVMFTESTFVDILKSNPALRVLKINLKIADMLPDDALVTPVRLSDLQAIVLGSRNKKHLGKVLRWLHLGSRPLSLSIHCPYRKSTDPNFPADTETRKFMARSNITKLRLRSVDSSQQMEELLEMAPTAQALVVDWVGHEGSIVGRPLPKPYPLDSLYITSTAYLKYHAPNWRRVRRFVERHAVRELTVWNPNFPPLWGAPGTRPNLGDVHTFCPVVNIITERKLHPGGD